MGRLRVWPQPHRHGIASASLPSRDSVVTPFAIILRILGETACTLVTLRKLRTLQETILERFPKQAVATATERK